MLSNFVDYHRLHHYRPLLPTFSPPQQLFSATAITARNCSSWSYASILISINWETLASLLRHVAFTSPHTIRLLWPATSSRPCVMGIFPTLPDLGTADHFLNSYIMITTAWSDPNENYQYSSKFRGQDGRSYVPLILDIVQFLLFYNQFPHVISFFISQFPAKSVSLFFSYFPFFISIPLSLSSFIADRVGLQLSLHWSWRCPSDFHC